MPFINGGHLWIILILLVVVLIIWGPGKLPDVGSGLGRAIREFRKASSDTKEEFAKATRPEPVAAEPAAAAGTVANPPATAPEAAVQAMPGTLAEPAPVGGGSATARPTEHVAGEGEQTTAI
jgi:TatA/E family protein of Tat protein translocase